MKTVRNQTQAPLRVPLGGGRVLHLGPGQTGQIADDALEGKGVKRLLESGAIAVGGASGRPGDFGDDHGTPRERAHGHTHANKVFPSGDR
jgi:hypothetical protein